MGLAPLRRTVALPILALAVILGGGQSAWSARKTGTVVRVSDGDTVTVRFGTGDERVRLLGIDAPEHDQTPWGPRAARFLASQVEGRTVLVETDVQLRDRYRRLLGYLYVGGIFVNRELVRQGLAMLYTAPPNVAHTEDLLAAQREARAAGRNIWSPTTGLTETPYEFRHHRSPPPAIGQGGLPASRAGSARRAAEAPDILTAPGGAELGPAGRWSDPEARALTPLATAAAPWAVPPAGSGAGVIGNRRTRKYHAPTCPLAGHISRSNRVELGGAAQAEAAGMIPCRSCGGGRH